MAHILAAANSFDFNQGGGTTRIASDICRALAAHGHKVSVLAYNIDGKLPAHEQCEGIDIYRYRLPIRRLNMALPQDHIHAASLVLRSNITSPPDVIHGHTLFQFLAATAVFPATASRVYTIHSPATEELKIVWGKQGWRGFLKRRLGLPSIRSGETECFDRATALTALSDYTIAQIGAIFGPQVAQRIIKIPGWTDLARFRILEPDAVTEARIKLGWPTDKTVLFALRRLEPRMGLENLLFAAAALKSQGYDFALVVGGRGSLAGQLASLRDELGLADTVSFIGFVPEAIVADAYGACDASVVPTVALECFGIIVLESLACGRPALVTPVGALPELVAKIEPKWISAGIEPVALAALLGAFLQDELPQPPPQALRSFVDSHFNMDVGIKAIEDVLFAGKPKVDMLPSRAS